MRKLFASALVGAALMLTSLAAQAIPVTQLGFILDASGSVRSTNYNLLRTGLNAAIAGLPQDSTVEITVVTYANNASVVVAPTVLTAATLPTITAAISNHTYTGGFTNTAAGINLTTNQLINSVNFSDVGTTSAINLATDGFANRPNGSTQGQAAAVAASLAAGSAGIDSLSIEAIGSGITSTAGLNNMLALALPGPATLLALNSTNIPDPSLGSWVVPLTDFSNYAPVVNAKVQAIVNPPSPVPEPAAMSLLAAGLLGMYASRRRRKV